MPALEVCTLQTFRTGYFSALSDRADRLWKSDDSNVEVRMAISGVQMPSTMVDYSRDTSLNSNAGTGDPFSTPSSSSSSSSPADAQAMASSMLGSLPDLSSAWAGMAGA